MFDREENNSPESTLIPMFIDLSRHEIIFAILVRYEYVKKERKRYCHLLSSNLSLNKPIDMHAFAYTTDALLNKQAQLYSA